MKVEVERDALLRALEQVAGVVERRNTIPVLSNLLLVVGDGALSVTGTDLDIEATASVAATGELRTTVPAEKILAAVKSFKTGKLTIAPVDGRQAVTVKQGRGVRTLSTLSADDFPKRPALGQAVSFSIPCVSLARIFAKCTVAQSSDETRYYLMGIFLHTTDTKLRGAATDGHRLIRVEVDLPSGAGDMADIIVPKKAVAQVLQMIGKSTGDIAVQSNGTAIAFQLGDGTIISKLIEGTYPDYSRVIPEVAQNKISIVRDVLVAASSAVTSVVNAEGDKSKVRAVAIEMGVDDDMHEMTAKDQIGTSAVEPIAATYKGTPLRFGVNSQYLRDVAGIFAEGAALSITLHDPAAPLRIVSDNDPDLVGVIMPMRV
jgi:DNA polymerase-3 subunit beta